MRYAETGFNLEIDLSRGTIERVETDPRLTELHLGGQGTAAKIQWDRVPPEVEPFSPDNLLIFSAGLLDGTPFPLPIVPLLIRFLHRQTYIPIRYLEDILDRN